MCHYSSLLKKKQNRRRKMSEIITNRREIVFIYDIVNSNSNGDPVDENKPRIDEETGLNIVTDVRLKRTIRDYLYEFFTYGEKRVTLY
jgi:CRISPR/Cas system type I-B associated protein Csh2 (Cas7 group RAMP superfamily)